MSALACFLQLGMPGSGGPLALELRPAPIDRIAPLVNDAEVQRFLQNATAGGAALLEHRFRDGISAGEIPSDFPVAARATQVTDLARGLTMRAQIGMPGKTLLRDAEEAAELVLLPRRILTVI